MKRAGERFELIHTISSTVSEALAAEKLSQREFASRAGLSQPTVSRLIKGEARSLTGADLRRLASALGRPELSLVAPAAQDHTIEKAARPLSDAPWGLSLADLADWAGKIGARSQLTELIRQLLVATLPIGEPVEFQVLTGEDAQKKGWDGVVFSSSGALNTPAGRSYWELSVRKDFREKAAEDLNSASQRCREQGVPAKQATLVLVTPHDWDKLNATRDAWIATHGARSPFRDVKIIDGRILLDWIKAMPSVERWFAQLIGRRPEDEGFQTLEEYCADWNTRRMDFESSSRSLPLSVVLAGREQERDALRNAISGPYVRCIDLLGESQEEAIAFAVATLADEQRVAPRTVVVNSDGAWTKLSQHRWPLILIDRRSEREHPRPAAEPHVTLRPCRQVQNASDGVIPLRRMTPARVYEALKKKGWPEPLSREAAHASASGFGALMAMVEKSPKWADRARLAEVWPGLVLGFVPRARGSATSALVALAGHDLDQVCRASRALLGVPNPPVEEEEDGVRWLTVIATWRQTEDLWLNGNARAVLDVAEQAFCIESRGAFARQDREALARAIALIRWSGVASTEASGRAGRLASATLEAWLTEEPPTDLPGMEALAEAAPERFVELAPRAYEGAKLCVLGALGRLSWDELRLPGVVNCLLALDEKDPNGLGAFNRPMATLHAIVRSLWHSTVDGGARVRQTLEAAHDRGASPTALCTLLLHLVPRQPGVIWMPSAPPVFLPARRQVPSESPASRGGMTVADVEWMIDALITWPAVLEVGIWLSTVELLTSAIPANAAVTLTERLAAVAEQWGPGSTSRSRLREKLRDHLYGQHLCAGQSWVLSDSSLSRVHALHASLEPSDGAVTLADVAWLFEASQQHPDGTSARWFGTLPMDESGLRWLANAESGLRRWLGSTGDRLSLDRFEWPEPGSAGPAHFGWMLASNSEFRARAEPWLWALPDSQDVQQLRAGFISALPETEIVPAIEHRVSLDDLGGALPLLRRVPLDSERLDWLASLPQAFQDQYWTHTSVNPWLPEMENTVRAVGELASRGRSAFALNALCLSSWPPEPPGAYTQFATILRSLLDHMSAESSHDQWRDVEFALDVLEAAGVSETALCDLEARLLASDAYAHQCGLPKRVRQALSTSPRYAARVVQATYRPDRGQNIDNDIGTSDGHLRRIGNGFDFIRGLPFWPVELVPWSREFMALCVASGHEQGALELLGGLLGASAPDAGDQTLWPSRAVREVLRDLKRKDYDWPRLERAVCRGHFNSRGVRRIDPHDPARFEREEAERLESSAPRLAAGWQEAAAICEKLATGYRESEERELRRHRG